MNKENKPCPFCGSNYCYLAQDILIMSVKVFMYCPACKARGPETYTEEEAWEKWNKRSGEDDKHSS